MPEAGQAGDPDPAPGVNIRDTQRSGREPNQAAAALSRGYAGSPGPDSSPAGTKAAIPGHVTNLALDLEPPATADAVHCRISPRSRHVRYFGHGGVHGDARDQPVLHASTDAHTASCARAERRIRIVEREVPGVSQRRIEYALSVGGAFKAPGGTEWPVPVRVLRRFKGRESHGHRQEWRRPLISRVPGAGGRAVGLQAI